MLMIDELHKRLLIMAKELHKICEQNNISYTLMGGSLIGAIRHNGFIPWDDDLDIGLLYNDYIKLIEILKKMNNPWLEFDYALSENYELEYAKVYDSRTTCKEVNSNRIKGIFIDIFPIIPIANSYSKAKRRFIYDNVLKMSRYNKTNNSKSSKLKMIIYRMVGLLHTSEGLTKKIQKRRAKFAKKNYKLYCDPDGRIQGIVPKECFDGFMMHKFEDTELMIVKNYDMYLSLIFGDYLKLPSEDQRTSTHFEILDLNKSYKSLED